MKDRPGFFDFAAEVGLTKHIGGVEATDQLIALCQITKASYILDVGSGVGVTPCYLAKKCGCRVAGVDISERMVERSRERANREKISDRVDFRTADAQCLPFLNDSFDAVITESVTAFPADKQKAVSEYARVTKAGGFVGLNESVWLKVPPPPDVVAWASQDLGANIMPLTAEAWTELMGNAGLKDIKSKIYTIRAREEAQGIVRRYGWAGMFSALGRMLLLYARSADYRKFVQGVRDSGVTPHNLEEYFGYGLFIGQK